MTKPDDLFAGNIKVGYVDKGGMIFIISFYFNVNEAKKLAAWLEQAIKYREYVYNKEEYGWFE